MDTTTNPPFTGIYNFRDVGHVVNSLGGTKLIRDKFLYRSGRLDDATSADREKLVSEYDLRTVIDLRTKSEHIKQTQTLKAKNRYLAAANVNLQTDAAVPDQGPWTVHKINFAGRNFEMNMLKQLKWWQIIWLLTLMLLQFRMAAIRILGRNVLGPKGLLGLSKDSLRFCQAEIREALEVLTDFKTYPVLIHCTQGKDRSGLIVMLVLFVLGVPLEQVKADYALSNEGLAPVRASMIKEVEEIGMDADYTKAPPEVVETVWNFLQTEYGGVDEYLDLIGFPEQKRRTLRKLLLV
ncbi:protein-tyrosine phosphatase-like protein [Mycena albidolilacea]|uniref:Protein-tyrosine phosphatase-like protein n=1 Tax=Mycena albidolilacea TaxID=1033008 RepID=A0AAD7AAF2_9AGAR|nr:protein-tyrosine phosphatase-like protein [Mycena albidolilacea]